VKTLIALLILAALGSGCTNLKGYKASEIHRTTSYPLVFTSQVDATGVEKVTNADGKVVRRAKTLTITTTAGGYSSTTVLKDAELESEE